MRGCDWEQQVTFCPLTLSLLLGYLLSLRKLRLISQELQSVEEAIIKVASS